MRNERLNEVEEITRVLKAPQNGVWESGGPILLYDNKIPYYYEKEGHCLYLGRTGMGKTFYGIENQVTSIIKARQSFLLPITKGNTLEKVKKLIPQEYTIKTLNFRQIGKSAGFNPLIFPYRLYKTGDPEQMQIALELVEELAFGLYPADNSKDPFWENSARTIFIALSELLFVHAKCEQQVNLFNLFRLVMDGDERFNGSNLLKEWVNLEPPTSVSRMNMQSYVNAPNETKGGIRSVYFNGLNPYIRTDAIAQMLSNDDIKMDELTGDKPTAILISLPDETPIYNTICGCFLSQIIRYYIRLAENKYNGALPIKMHIIIDELASVARSIPNLDFLMAASRSRQIKITGVLQALSQLKDVYGESKADTILSNFGVTIAFSTNNFDTLQELSRRCGERKTADNRTEPLITPVQLGAMGIGQALILIENRYKYVVNLPSFSELFGKDLELNPTVHEEVAIVRKPIEVFDIKEEVKCGIKNSMNKSQKKETPPLECLFNPFDQPSSSNSSNNDQMSGIDVDELLKKIDAKIAELEAEEENEKSYIVAILSLGGKSRNIIQLNKIIAKTLSVSLHKAEDICKSVPIEVKLPSKEKAEKLLRQVEQLGFIGIMKPNTTEDN